MCAFERLARNLRCDNQHLAYERLRHLASSFIHNATNETGRASTKHLHKTLRKLKKNDSIRICSFDKGSGTVIMNSSEYYDKLDSIVFSNKFTELSVPDIEHHPVLKTEKSIQYYLRRYIKSHIDTNIFDRILPNGCQPGAIYGLAKVHKVGTPLRPVISMIKTPQYELAKFLNSYIKDVTPKTYMLESTDEFLGKVSSIQLNRSKYLVSFDVESLFTNIPLREVIDLACEKVYGAESIPPFEKRHFKKLLEYATAGEFLYKDRLFRQIDGVAMGSPLAPTLANLFMAQLESQWHSERFSPQYYYRYVDDVFCVFQNDADVDCFLNFLNCQHTNLNFTVEKGTNRLAFLDTLIQVEDDDVKSTVYRKPTYTGLMLNFHAYCPMQWKRGLISCFIHRAYRVCSNWSLFHSEIKILRKHFLSNGYPVNFFNSALYRFVNKLFCKDNSGVISVDQADNVFLVLPYFGSCSVQFRTRFSQFCKRFGVQGRLVFTSCRVSRYFSLKSRCPKLLRSMVCYRYICPVDQAFSYIGRTKRHLLTRVQEHVSPRGNSPIMNHILDCTCNFERGNFSILQQCKNDLDLQITEALLITQHKPSLNTALANNGASVFLKL